MSTGTKRIDNAVIHSLQGFRIADTTCHLPNQNLSSSALRASGTADAAAVTRLAECQNRLHAVLSIRAQRIPALRSIGLQCIAREEMNTRLNTVGLVSVDIDRAAVSSPGSIACGIAICAEGSPIADICAITLIAVIKRRHTSFRGGSKRGCRHQAQHHQDTKHTRKNSFRFSFQIHALPSFLDFVFDCEDKKWSVATKAAPLEREAHSCFIPRHPPRRQVPDPRSHIPRHHRILCLHQYWSRFSSA